MDMRSYQMDIRARARMSQPLPKARVSRVILEGLAVVIGVITLTLDLLLLIGGRQ